MKPIVEASIADVQVFVSARKRRTSTDIELRKYAKYNLKRRAGGTPRAQERENNRRYRASGHPIGKSRSPWTVDDMVRLEDLVAQGLSQRQISWIMGRGYNSIASRWRNRARTGLVHQWEVLDLQRLLELKARRLTHVEIAAKMGRTAASIGHASIHYRCGDRTNKKRKYHDKITA